MGFSTWKRRGHRPLIMVAEHSLSGPRGVKSVLLIHKEGFPIGRFVNYCGGGEVEAKRQGNRVSVAGRNLKMGDLGRELVPVLSQGPFHPYNLMIS